MPLDKIINYLHRLEDFIVSLLLSSILLFAVGQMIMRNIFDSGIVWGDSLLRILVLWLGLAGAIVASRNGKQISIDALSQFFSKKYKKIIRNINNLFTAVICLIISYYSFLFVRLEYQDGIIAFANIPAWITEAIIPVAFAIMGIKYLALFSVYKKL